MSANWTPEDLRIVLVGKTGTGKSASGNTILGRVKFESELSSSSLTTENKKATEKVDGKEVAVIDTPGLFDTEKSRTNKDIIQEIAKCISMFAPGPHVFLVVIEIGRFTPEEQNTVKTLQDNFGVDSSMYTMVLFTHGDKLKRKPIEEFLSKNKNLMEFTRACRGGYHVFNNEDMRNRSQVTELLQKIKALVTLNGGGCYTNEMFKAAERAVREKMERILEEQKKAGKPINEEVKKRARQQAEKDNSFTKSAAVVAGSAAAGGLAGVGIYALLKAGLAAGAPLGPFGMAVGAAVGAATGAVVGLKVSK